MPGDYSMVDDQARLMTKTLWEARFWSVATGALAVGAAAILFIGGLQLMPVIGALATAAAAVYSKFRSDETWTEYDILAHAVAEEQASSRFAAQLAKQQERIMEKEAKLEMEIAKQEAAYYNGGSQRGDQASSPPSDNGYSQRIQPRRNEKGWSDSLDNPPSPAGGRNY